MVLACQSAMTVSKDKEQYCKLRFSKNWPKFSKGGCQETCVKGERHGPHLISQKQCATQKIYIMLRAIQSAMTVSNDKE